MEFDVLLSENREVHIDTVKFTSDNIKGLYMDGNIALSNKLKTTSEKKCVLAEELGHHYTTTGNILDQKKSNNRKQERIARMWAYNKLLGFDALIDAFEHCCRNRYEVAEYLGVTEQFLLDSINAYSHKFGNYVCYKNYIIEFNESSVGIIKNLEGRL